MRWSNKEINLVEECIKLGNTHQEIAEFLNEDFNTSRTAAAVEHKCRLLGLISKNKKLKTTKQFEEDLYIINNNIVVLSEYISSKDKIIVQCKIDNNTWETRASDLLTGRGCPICAIDSKTPKVTYLLYFPILNLYKIGITSNLKRRCLEFGHNVEILLYRYFKNGQDAYKLEQKWINNIKNLKINTGLLISGNTETFKYG